MATKKAPATEVEYKLTTIDKRQVAVMEEWSAKIAELAEQLTWDDEKLDAMLLHVEEQEVVKGAKTKCTNMRTAITEAHKTAKAPYLSMGKLLDGMKNKMIADVQAIEAPLDAAILRRKQREEEAAKKAAEAKRAKEKTELDRLRELLIQNGIDPDADAPKEAEFEEMQLTFTADDSHNKALSSLLGSRQFRKLLFGTDGEEYELEVNVKRVAIKVVEEEELPDEEEEEEDDA